jgi:3-hydroxyisobutyrate dehydrogenase-like beta-hydroxyacid dehydrogenase
MSRNLARAGHELIVFDVNQAALAAAVAAGARQAVSAADAAARAEAVFVSVPGPEHDEEVMLGADGILAGAQTGLLVIDTTTVTVPLSRRLAALAAGAGIDYLEAPVSGAPHGAEAGTLTVMAGGGEAVFARARPLLECIGANIRLIGESGCGTAIKLINQAVYVSYMAVFAEGLALGEEAGIALDTLLEVLGSSAAGHPMIEQKYDEIRGIKNTGFAIERALLFMELAHDAFGDSRYSTPVIDAANASLRRAAAKGLADKDLIIARKQYL